MAMVGRTGELARLARVWTDLASGAGGRTVVVTGDAGTGKSLLLATAVERLTPGPAIILSGAARAHSPAPYDWLASVLSGLECRGQRVAPDGVPPDALTWLAQHPDAARERYTPDSLLRMAVRVVRYLVADGPAVLQVEDLHALDPASLNLVAELATAPGLPGLLLVSSRLTDAPLPRRVLARLTGAPGAVRLHLPPLSTSEVAVLLAERYPGVSDAVVRSVAERTGGNPYRLTELLAVAPTLAGLPAPAEPAVAGGSAVSGSAGGRAVSGTAGRAAREAELTAREHEVLACLAAGMSNRQIARSLGISIRTVTVHVSNLLRKTGAASRTEAALWAVRHQPA